MLNLFQLKQMITEPTRITENSETLIDLFITSEAENIHSSGVMHIQ